MSQPPVILVIEDELPIRRFLRPPIEGAGYRLIEADSAKTGLLSASQFPPDVVILDLGLPDSDGLLVIKQLREWYRGPILVLSARGQEADKVVALDAGADDYVSKPFSVVELLARIRVAIRHSAGAAGPAPQTLAVGDWEIDLVRRDVRRGGQLVRLTPIEYKLLAALVRHVGLVLTHQHLLREVWGPGHAHDAQYLRLYMHQLRQKLEDNPARPRYLTTEVGVGYRLRVD